MEKAWNHPSINKNIRMIRAKGLLLPSGSKWLKCLPGTPLDSSCSLASDHATMPQAFPPWIMMQCNCDNCDNCGIGVTRPNLHFFQYIQAYKPFADPVPYNTKQYQLTLTNYQPLSSYTDPEPSNTSYNSSSRKGRGKKIDVFLGKSPKLWVGGGQGS